MSTQALKTFSFSVADDAGNRRPATPAELATDLRQRFAGFVDLVTAADVPVANNQASGTYPDGPADLRRTTTACGQVLAIVLADEPQEALDIAWWVQQHCIDYGPVAGHDGSPLGSRCSPSTRRSSAGNFLPDDALRHRPDHPAPAPTCRGSTTTRPSSTASSASWSAARTRRVPRRCTSTWRPQSAVVSPGEGRQMTVLSSTQNPDTVHGATSAALGLDSNEVDVQIRRVGGGYGGKDHAVTVGGDQRRRRRRPRWAAR